MKMVFWVLVMMMWVMKETQGRFVVEKSSISVLSPIDIRSKHDAAIGNFGVPDYGGSMVGSVVYPQKPDSAFGCSQFQGDKPYKSKSSSRPTILLLDRGERSWLSLLGKMAILMPRIIQAKQILRRSLSNGSNNTYKAIPKGYFAVYVGEQDKKRFVVPVSLLNQPAFQDLLNQAEEEFGYSHPMGGLTIPCSEYIFTNLASRLGAL